MLEQLVGQALRLLPDLAELALHQLFLGYLLLMLVAEAEAATIGVRQGRLGREVQAVVALVAIQQQQPLDLQTPEAVVVEEVTAEADLLHKTAAPAAPVSSS